MQKNREAEVQDLPFWFELNLHLIIIWFGDRLTHSTTNLSLLQKPNFSRIVRYQRIQLGILREITLPGIVVELHSSSTTPFLPRISVGFGVLGS